MLSIVTFNTSIIVETLDTNKFKFMNSEEKNSLPCEFLPFLEYFFYKIIKSHRCFNFYQIGISLSFEKILITEETLFDLFIPKINQHLVSPNNISTLSRKHMMRIYRFVNEGHCFDVVSEK